MNAERVDSRRDEPKDMSMLTGFGSLGSVFGVIVVRPNLEPWVDAEALEADRRVVSRDRHRAPSSSKREPT